MDKLKQNLPKVIVLLVILAAVAAFFALDLGKYLTFEYLKESRNEFQQYYDENPLLVLGGFFVTYVLVTSLSLPGAAIMTLAGGALFGLVTGTILVSFASSIGATIAMIVSRFLLGNYVQEKFQNQVKTINRKIEEEGAFYLFTMRLVPAFPFFVINLTMGLTRIKAVTFYWISQLGMLPGTIVFVNAGSELGQLDSLSGILSPGLIISFVILGVFPLAVKKIMGYVQKKRGVVKNTEER